MVESNSNSILSSRKSHSILLSLSTFIISYIFLIILYSINKNGRQFYFSFKIIAQRTGNELFEKMTHSVWLQYLLLHVFPLMSNLGYEVFFTTFFDINCFYLFFIYTLFVNKLFLVSLLITYSSTVIGMP